MSADIAYSRSLLQDAAAEARKLGAKIKEGWVHNTGGTWEFVYGDFHDAFQASNAYHAKAQGWERWAERETKRRALPAQIAATFRKVAYDLGDSAYVGPRVLSQEALHHLRVGLRRLPLPVTKEHLDAIFLNPTQVSEPAGSAEYLDWIGLAFLFVNSGSLDDCSPRERSEAVERLLTSVDELDL